MGNNVRAEQVNAKEYLKSKLRAFAETFATLGNMIGGTSNVTKLTDAEREADEIRKKYDSSNIAKLESRVQIPEKENQRTRTKTTKPQQYNVTTTIQQNSNLNVAEQSKNSRQQIENDDYLK